jgi:serine/threonine protein phosphatase PrpC
MLSDEEISHIILKNKGNIEQATQSLVRKAKDNGGTDNITAILVEV